MPVGNTTSVGENTGYEKDIRPSGDNENLPVRAPVGKEHLNEDGQGKTLDFRTRTVRDFKSNPRTGPELGHGGIVDAKDDRGL